MKKLLLIAAALTAFQFQGTAQNKQNNGRGQYLSIGPVVGGGANWVSNLGGSSNSMIASGNLGVGLIYAKDAHWGWGTQLTAASEGYDVKYGANEVKAVPIYLRMPIRAYYFFGDLKSIVRPKVYLGPQFGLKLTETDHMTSPFTETTVYNNTGNFRTFDAGINAGAGVNIRLMKATWLNLDLGYYQGVLDVVKDPADNYNTNQNLGINAGVLFGL